MSEQAPERPTRGRPAPAKGKENVLTRKIGPLPTWGWVAVVASLLLLYVFWSNNKSAQSSSSSGTGTGKATGLTSLVPPVIVHGARGKRGKRGKKGKSGGDDDDQESDREGPEREWLEKKTGSEHPWSYLARHHETISVGPRGSRITHDGKTDHTRSTKHHAKHHPKPKDKDGPQPGDQDKAPKEMAARGVPGTSGGVTGQLVSFTTPESGTTPSLAQVASQYNTAPDAIIEEATGRGNPHGAMWRRYVAANDWQKPLPHGTDMTILAQPQ